MLLQIANDAFIVHDEQNCIRFWSDGAHRLYGYSAQEVVGKRAAELLHTQFPLSLPATHALQHHHWEGELIHTKKEGNRITVNSRWELLENTSAYRILEVNLDISERKEQERRKDEFLAMASHELKTPLTSLKGFLQLLVQHLLIPA